MKIFSSCSTKDSRKQNLYGTPNFKKIIQEVGQWRKNLCNQILHEFELLVIDHSNETFPAIWRSSIYIQK